MSFILDALRKLEQERHQGTVSSVSSAAGAIGGRRSRVWTIAAMVAVGLASGVVTAAILRMTATSAPPEVAEPGGPGEALASPPEVATVTAVEPAYVEPPVSPTPRVERRPISRETAPRDDASGDLAPAEPVANDEASPNIRLVGHDSPTRGSGATSDAPPEPPNTSDPFPHLVLQGTSVIDGQPVAVISDRRVFEGDQIEGAFVIRIGEREVELEFEGRRFTISL